MREAEEKEEEEREGGRGGAKCVLALPTASLGA